MIDDPAKRQNDDVLWAVGSMTVGGSRLPYPVSRRDIERDTEWAQGRLQAAGVEAGAVVLFVASCGEWGQSWPYQNAAMRLSAPYLTAEDSPWDASRSEMFLRRFRCRVAFGISAGLLDGLQQAGHALDTVFADAGCVMARPEAAVRLREAGLAPWTLLPLGPMFALAAPDDAGAVYDEQEWLVEEADGELLLTSLAPRACPLVRLHTGVRGRVVAAADDGLPRRIVCV